MVIVVTPLINYVSGFVQRPEPMGIQALFTDLFIEALNECIFCPLTWPDKGVLSTGFLSPKGNLFAGEPGSVVADNRLRSLEL